MHYLIEQQGFVHQTAPAARNADIAIGPRIVVLPSGEAVCSFMFTARTATNDFVPVLSRSRDGGRTWSEPWPVFPGLRERWSIFTGISRDPRSGELFLFGTRTPIGTPGESNWSTATKGLLANELIWSRSTDEGHTWSEPAVIAMPFPASAEAPGPLCVTRSGRWLGCYSPYPTFDPKLHVDSSQVVVMFSDDRGQSWQSRTMLRFERDDIGAAEAWVVELADGRLLGSCWRVANDEPDVPNGYAISEDDGNSWSSTRSTGTLGQTTALTPIAAPAAGLSNAAPAAEFPGAAPAAGLTNAAPAAETSGAAPAAEASGAAPAAVWFLYNQRRHGPPGVRLALARPSRESFNIVHDDYLFRAETRTQSASSGALNEWSDFSFGEPALARLPDGSWLGVLWCIQPSGTGIRYVRMRVEP